MSSNYDPTDSFYTRAKGLLDAQPRLGKKKLARLLQAHQGHARRLLERWRGETQGPGNNPEYLSVEQVKRAHPRWGAHRIAHALGLTLDRAKLHLARWMGVQSRSQTAGAVSKAVAIPPPAQTSAAPATPPESPASMPEAPANGSELQDTVRPDSRDLCYRGTRIHTLEDLLVFAEVNTSLWEVERHVINKWEVGARNPATGEILVEQLFQVKAWLKRRVAERRLEDLLNSMLAEFRKAAPERPALSRPPAGAGTLEVSLMDLHLGKLAWGPETGGRSYDASIMENMFWAALEDLLDKASGCKPGQILFVAGNDFFNTDSLGRTTTAGTPQDEMVRWQDSFTRGRNLLVKAIERMRTFAPIKVLMVPGNHDTQRLYYLGEVLHAWFHRTADVQVDYSPATRKYFAHGANLIGFTHGNNERHPNLPLLMATEQPEKWAKSRHREFHLGHFHTKKHKMFVPAEDLSGVLVRILPSLCPPDAWHASMGYSSKLAAEAYYWDPEDGCVATFTHSPA